MNQSLLTLVLTALLAGSACRTGGQQSMNPTDPAAPVHAQPTRAWELVHQGQVLGIVILFLEQGGQRQFHSIRNAQQQDLGLVDHLGRAWRYVPHSAKPEWLTTSTVMEGARAILGLGPDIERYEVPLRTLQLESAAAPLD